jgi:ribosomal protein S18 acetylase RimI-like enzyme
VSDGLAAHRALVELWTKLYAEIDGTRFEARSDLIVAVCPGFSEPPFNGAWVETDSQAAVDALPAAISEVEAAGERPWVQCRSGHERTLVAARALRLTHVERLPGMTARPGELVATGVELDVALVSGDDLEESIAVLAAAFGEPQAFFARLSEPMLRLPGARWYVGRRAGAIVSTALGVTIGGATGIFNVATLPEHRGRGYGGALTVRAARDGFAEGAEFAYLHSSEIGHSLYRRLGFRDVEEYVVLARPEDVEPRASPRH